MSTFRSFTLNGSLPTICTASVWKRMPFSFAIAPISAIGWMTPISLLAAMIVMRIVLSLIAAFSWSRLISPSFRTARYVTR